MRASRSRIWRRRLVALGLLAAALAAAYWLWLRDSSLFAVDEVELRGATANRARLAAALERRAEGMTTLHVDEDELVEAAQGFPTVASIAVDASPPGKLTITVSERLPVAVVELDGEPTGVAADGQLLTGLDLGGRELPAIEGSRARAGRLDERGSAQAAILGAAPPGLRRRVAAVRWDEQLDGVAIELEGGPEARFGDGGEAAEKWRALAAVLLRPAARGGRLRRRQRPRARRGRRLRAGRAPLQPRVHRREHPSGGRARPWQGRRKRRGNPHFAGIFLTLDLASTSSFRSG